jgi:hypothetical protein
MGGEWIAAAPAKAKAPGIPEAFIGAGDRIRTGDPQLGKLKLYH